MGFNSGFKGLIA